MERWIGKIALVTGASAGIGETIAKAFVKSGLQVVGLARRVERVQELADSLKGCKGTLHPIKCDLTKEQDILDAFDWTNRKFGGIDVLVNNAGVVTVGSVSEGTTESFRQILDLNLLAVAICSREAIKSMRSRNTEGHIFFINSVLGYNANYTKFPTGIYPASKYALRGLVENYTQEIDVAHDNIKTTTIIPGLVKTNLFKASGGDDEVFNHFSYVYSTDIADGIMYALGTRPGVRVDELRITPLRCKL